jgi:hypothetical protein
VERRSFQRTRPHARVLLLCWLRACPGTPVCSLPRAHTRHCAIISVHPRIGRTPRARAFAASRTVGAFGVREERVGEVKVGVHDLLARWSGSLPWLSIDPPPRPLSPHVPPPNDQSRHAIRAMDEGVG